VVFPVERPGGHAGVRSGRRGSGDHGGSLGSWLTLVVVVVLLVAAVFAQRSSHSGGDHRPALVVGDSVVEDVISAIAKAARTGEIGDGRVFVVPVTHSYRIRTGENEAL